MAINVFGVTATSVKDHHFPHWDGFTTATTPTLATVTLMIDESGAVLAGKLSVEGIVPSTITDATSAAYAWCATVVRLHAAIKVMQASTAQDPAIIERWEKMLAALFKDLATNGATAIGPGASSISNPSGPDTHIETYSLEVDSAEDMSTTVPVFRRDDLL